MSSPHRSQPPTRTYSTRPADGGKATTGARAPFSDVRPPAALRLLSGIWATVGGSRTGRRLLKVSGIKPLGRAWLRGSVLKPQRSRPDDVTVLIGVRDRSDYRIVNALRSLQDQTDLPAPLKVIVVDYGSQPAGAQALETTCEHHGVAYVRVEVSGIWSRGRCLNVGLRLVDTKFAMVSDADIVFSPRYVADAVEELRKAPLSAVCSTMLDLPEGTSEALSDAAGAGAPLDLEPFRELCTPRLNRELHSSIAITHTEFYRAIRGYDEYYEGWSNEDADLMRRFRALGLRPKLLTSSSFYLHQWHPKFEGLMAQERTCSAERNTAYFRTQRSILRNRRGWGDPRNARAE